MYTRYNTKYNCYDSGSDSDDSESESYKYRYFSNLGEILRQTKYKKYIHSKQRGKGAAPVYHYILHQLFEYMSTRELAEICGVFIISTAIRDAFKRENVSRYLTMNCDDLKNEINIVIYTTKYSDYGKEIKRNLERNLGKLKTSYLRKEWLNKYYNDKEYTPLDFESVAFRSFVTS